MTTVAITGLPVAATINSTDIIPFVQLAIPPATGNTTKSITKTNLFTSPTMVTPVLGTVSSGVISACTSTSMVMVTPVIGAATGTSLSTTGNQVISGTGKQGYATGAGGVVTQGSASGKGTTLAAIDKSCGQITMDGAALAASTTVSFIMPNTTIEAGDIIVMNHISGGTLGAYTLNASCGGGTATIYVRNVTLASLSDAVVLRFAVIKVVSA